MILRDARIINYRINPKLIGKIQMVSNVDLNHEDLEILLEVSNLLDSHPDFKNQRTRLLILIFVGSGSVTLDFDTNPLQIGSQASYAFINVDEYRKYNYIRRVVVVLEEMVHHFWDESDEIEASRIVCEMLENVDYDTVTGNYIFPL